MSPAEIILIALGLAMDAAAVSLAAAAAGFAGSARARFRLSFHFGLFQFFMPVLGWFAGTGFVSHVQSTAPWIAFLLLGFVGTRMVREGLDRSGQIHKKDPSRGMTMIMLSLATSIDALAVGLSLAVLKVRILLPGVVIGIVTVLMSLLAMSLGTRLGTVFGKRMEIFGGTLLILIGSRILISHLL